MRLRILFSGIEKAFAANKRRYETIQVNRNLSLNQKFKTVRESIETMLDDLKVERVFVNVKDESVKVRVCGTDKERLNTLQELQKLV